MPNLKVFVSYTTFMLSDEEKIPARISDWGRKHGYDVRLWAKVSKEDDKKYNTEFVDECLDPLVFSVCYQGYGIDLKYDAEIDSPEYKDCWHTHSDSCSMKYMLKQANDCIGLLLRIDMPYIMKAKWRADDSRMGQELHHMTSTAKMPIFLIADHRNEKWKGTVLNHANRIASDLRELGYNVDVFETNERVQLNDPERMYNELKIMLHLAINGSLKTVGEQKRAACHKPHRPS